MLSDTQPITHFPAVGSSQNFHFHWDFDRQGDQNLNENGNLTVWCETCVKNGLAWASAQLKIYYDFKSVSSRSVFLQANGSPRT